MKVRSVVMHARALPTRLPHLQRKHAVLLVAGVLLLHLWLLAGAPLWLAPESGKPLRTQALVTRQIEVAAPRAPQVPQPVPPQPAKPAPAAVSEAPAEPAESAKPLKFDDFGHDLTAPVSLPARSATGVDLPPYKRAGSEGLTDVTAFKAPESAFLKYQVQGQAKGLNYWASAELNWQQDGKDYEARLSVSAFLLGSRTQISKGTLGVEGIMPTRFGDKTRSELAAHFQRDKNIISFSANTPDVPLLPGAQDQLSVFMQLASLLAGNSAQGAAGKSISLQAIGDRYAEQWTFKAGAPEMVKLANGPVSAIKFTHEPSAERKQRLELWYAPNLQFLPVRIRITESNGDYLDLVWANSQNR